MSTKYKVEMLIELDQDTHHGHSAIRGMLARILLIEGRNAGYRGLRLATNTNDMVCELIVPTTTVPTTTVTTITRGARWEDRGEGSAWGPHILVRLADEKYAIVGSQDGDAWSHEGELEAVLYEFNDAGARFTLVHAGSGVGTTAVWEGEVDL